MLEDTRYELKFICYERSYEDLLRWIKHSKFMMRKSYPARIVNSIYFDDNNFTCFQENLAGISRREKVRYRWYGKSFEPLAGTLEVKNRLNSLGWKYLHPIEELGFSKGDNWLNFVADIKSKVPDGFKYFLNKYTEPTLITRYHRDYYESFDKKIRVTVDRKQRSTRQISMLSANFTNKSHYSDIVTLEVKANSVHRQLVTDMVHNIPIRRSRYSKYVAGLIASGIY